jgi:hypothetical protein
MPGEWRQHGRCAAVAPSAARPASAVEPREWLPCDLRILGAGEFARLVARLGVWRSSATMTGFVELARCAARSTRSSFHALSEGKTRFWVAGLGDQLAHRLGRGRFRGEDDLPGTLGRVTTDHPVILLAHEPDIFVRVPPRVSLTLAGHTHGGQIPIPLLWPSFVPSRYGACAPLEPFPIPCRGRGFGLRTSSMPMSGSWSDVCVTGPVCTHRKPARGPWRPLPRSAPDRSPRRQRRNHRPARQASAHSGQGGTKIRGFPGAA